MCGINGIAFYQDNAKRHRRALEIMNAAVKRRGPDDEGYFFQNNVGLSHRRLSIIDLSPNARQPLCNEDGTIWLTFNGEIYNYQELRSELIADGHRFRSLTDSEVIVHAYEKWSTDFLQKLDGMFAFGLYDANKEKLILAKDRFGKKPLYYSLQKRCLLFSSSLKAFKETSIVDWRLNMQALSKYLIYEYIPTPHTIIHNVFKLPAAHYVEFDTRVFPSLKPVPRPYWELRFQPKMAISEDEACSCFVELLHAAVEKRLMSDVPLGVFLSGGIDSSAVVASMAEYLKAENIKTFSIKFSQKSYDESPYARLVARHFGTDHYEIEIDPDDVQGVLTEVVSLIDEPFADPSIIPTYLLSKFTRETVKVALDGGGADEMLAGYDTFVAHKIAKYYRIIPAQINKALYALTNRLPVSTRYMSMDFRVKRFLSGFLGRTPDIPEIRDLVWMSAFSPDALSEIQKDWEEESMSCESIFGDVISNVSSNSSTDNVDRIVQHYLLLYHHDDILYKVDRASMMNSLEVRCPFLDMELAEFINRLPSSYKMKGFRRKYLLKKAMSGILPNAIIKKRKQGFAMPVSDWFKGKLKPLLQDTLSTRKLSRQGLFSVQSIDRLIQDHLEGRQDNRKALWALFVGTLWLDENKPAIG